MPNYCDYSMKIVGSKESCEEFVARLTDYDKPKHFWRIFEAYTDDGGDDRNGNHTVYISGYCAWSLESCCRASGYSDGVDLFAVNTEELSLDLEAYSREPGIEFEEHYIYSKGTCLQDECREIDVFWWNEDEYPAYEDFKAEYPDAPPESDFDEGGEAYLGGFGDDFCHWHI